MKRTICSLLSAISLILLSSCSGSDKTGTAVLSGEIIGDCEELIILVYKPGSFTEYLYPDHKDGKFRIECTGVDGFVDFGVGIDQEVYGAHVNAGDSLHMVCSPLGDGKYDVGYTGSTERESRIWTDFYDVYGYWGQYNIRADKDPDMTNEQALALLASKDSAFREKYGSELDAYQGHYADLMCRFFKAVLMSDELYEAGIDPVSLPEYQALFDDLDPNDPFVVSSGLINRMVGCRMYDLAGEDVLAGIYAFIEGPGRKIKSESTRAVIAESLAIDISGLENADYDTVESAFDFVASYSPGTDGSVERYRKIYEEQMKVRRGMDIPDITLRTPEGTEVKLSSLYGKVLYIDIWATWCGPCVKETPFMAELAARFKDYDDRIAFLSISSDDDDDEAKWLAKISADAPAWPQYRMDESQYKIFSSALGIHAIPRFVILDPAGKLYEADAPRPSSEGIDDYIKSIL